MFKSLLAILLLCATPCFSKWITVEPHATPTQYPEDLVQIGIGNYYLLLERPEQALAQFDLARSLGHCSMDVKASQFFILFGQIIAYDLLGKPDLCEQSRDAFIALCEEEELDEKEADEVDEALDETFQAGIAVLYQLAALCPTVEVKAFLTDMLDEISKDDENA